MHGAHYPGHAETGFHHAWTSQGEDVPAIGRVFREHDYFVEFITAQDRRETLQKFRLLYCFNRFSPADRHVLYVDVDPDQSVPTLSAVFGAADWHERETWEMYGVPFAGHPNLKQLLLPEDADFFALRKDFGRMEDVAASSESGE